MQPLINIIYTQNMSKRLLVLVGLIVTVTILAGIVIVWSPKKGSISNPRPASLPLRPPRVYSPSLARLDQDPVSLKDKPISRVDLLEKGFTTKDDAGNYFLYGIFKTASGKTLVAGVVTETQEKTSLQLTLVDEYGDKLPVVVELTPDSQKTFPVGTVNMPSVLDLSKSVNISQVRLDSLKNTLIGQRIAAETESYSTQTETLKAKVLYIKDLNAISK